MSTPISAGTVWAIIVTVAVVTFGFRLSFFLLFKRIDEVPPWAERVLSYVAPAVLAALVVPDLVSIDGGVSVVNPRLIAGIVAGFVAWRTENLAATVAGGMVVFWIARGFA
ncbi:AzlD domain-containing protein [Natrinema ejinorense]|uniref:AzlD domain-containing protein n=1 Tax=Natrinema ejinorense TaxID=373386 RepID=UPI001B80810F|nr:AzlD domain-containing protein [Natrinema ejinorense]